VNGFSTTCLSLILLALSGPGNASQDLTNYTNLPLVTNPNPESIQTTLTLEEIWRLDCSEDADILIGRIKKAAAAQNGNVLLLDTQLNQAHEVDIDGKVVRTYGSQGEGPGETTGAFDLCQLSDGRVAIMEGSPARTMKLSGQGQIHLLAPNGDPLEVWRPADEKVAGEFPNLRALRVSGKRILVGYQLTQVSPPELTWTNHLILMDEDGHQLALLGEKVFVSNFSGTTSRESDEHEPFSGGRFDIDAGGRMAMVPDRDLYRVVVRNMDGSGFQLEMPAHNCQRAKEVIDEMVESNSAGPFIFEALPNKPEIRRVRWRPNGSLWVEHCSNQDDLPENVFIRFDEFDETGVFRRQVAVNVPGNPQTDRLILLSDGRFVMIRNLDNPEGESTSEGGSDLEVILYANPEQ